MFKLSQTSRICIKSLVQIKSQSLNKTIIRTKRQIFSRRPVKVVTEEGKDFYQQKDYQQPISSHDKEIRPQFLSQNDRQKYNQYYDEGFDEENLDLEEDKPSYYENRYKKSKISPKSVDINDISKQKFDERVGKRQTNEFKERRDKTTKNVPKVPGIPVYQKIGDKNSEFVNIMSILKTRKRREKENLMLLEGKRLICDAIDANVKIKTIYFTKEENLVGIQDLNELIAKGVQLKKVLYRDMKLFSELTTSPGVIAISERPDHNCLTAIKESYFNQMLPLILIGDNVRDPGNLGTMVRCAAAVGAQKIVLLKGCADPWESKVLRSGAGAHFRIPIYSDVEWPLIFNHIPIDKPFDLFIADPNEDKIIGDKDSPQIPSHTINTITREIDYTTEETYVRDESYDDSNPDLIKYRNLSLPLISYMDSKFYTLGIERPTVLVIGGETHGLSNQSYKLVYDYIGRKIKIPLALGVDSLNSAVSAAVIMYEMKRQFESRHNYSSVKSFETKTNG